MNDKLSNAIKIFCDATGFIHNAEVVHGSLFCKLNNLTDFTYTKNALKGFFKFYNGDNVIIKGYKLDGDNYSFDFI